MKIGNQGNHTRKRKRTLKDRMKSHYAKACAGIEPFASDLRALAWRMHQKHLKERREYAKLCA